MWSQEKQKFPIKIKIKKKIFNSKQTVFEALIYNIIHCQY